MFIRGLRRAAIITGAAATLALAAGASAQALGATAGPHAATDSHSKAVAVAATATVMTSSTARLATDRMPSAPDAASQCPPGNTCAWVGINYTGRYGGVEGDNTNDEQYPIWGQEAESVANNGTECTDWVYQYQNYGGYNYELLRGYGVSNLSGTWAWHHLWSNHWCTPN